MYPWACDERRKIRTHNEPEGHGVEPRQPWPANKNADCVRLLKAREEVKQQQQLWRRRVVELLAPLARLRRGVRNTRAKDEKKKSVGIKL